MVTGRSGRDIVVMGGESSERASECLHEEVLSEELEGGE